MTCRCYCNIVVKTKCGEAVYVKVVLKKSFPNEAPVVYIDMEENKLAKVDYLVGNEVCIPYVNKWGNGKSSFYLVKCFSYSTRLP